MADSNSYDPQQFFEHTLADGHSRDPGHADMFVVVPEKQTSSFGFIDSSLSKMAGLLQLPIRLTNGRHRSSGGYGIAHMLEGHDSGIALHGYWSVQDFVYEVAQEFDAVYEGYQGRWLLVYRKGKNPSLLRLLVIELGRQRDHYSVVSGWFVSTRRPVSGKLVAEKIEKDGTIAWERRAPRSEGPG